MPRRRKRERSGIGRFAVASVVVITLPLIGWAAARALTGADSGTGADDPTPASASAGSSADGAATPPTGAATGSINSYEAANQAQNAIRTCAARLDAGEELVAVAEVGIGHWHEHVQARTDMLAGAISQEEMRAIWKRTRLAGADDVTRANTALDAYEAQPPCTGLADVEATERLVQRAQDCLAREVSVDAAVVAATAAMGDWANHLNAMISHANGDMDGLEAQELWVSAWAAAPTNIGGFNDARDQLTGAPSCG